MMNLEEKRNSVLSPKTLKIKTKINLKIHLDLKVRNKNQVVEIGAFKI